MKRGIRVIILQTNEVGIVYPEGFNIEGKVKVEGKPELYFPSELDILGFYN